MHNRRRDFLLLVILVAASMTSASGQGVAPAVGPGNSSTQSTASIPDLSGKEHAQSNNPGSGPRVDPNYKGKGLQIELMVEDAGAFRMPWSASLTFRRALDEWPELVCAESIQWYPGTYYEVPTANKPDF